MRYLIKKKQPNSRSCLVCGLRNDLGFAASFYELDSNELLATFRPRSEHQSYPGRLHGGMISAILDETIGRSIMIGQEDVFGVSLEISVRFRKPVPLDQQLRVVSRITKVGNRFFEGTGELLLADNTVAATGHGRYMKMALEKIADFDTHQQQWKVVKSGDDPEFVDL